ncbi:MAG: FtsQ-type POTRA domain-containing protein [Clostridia bacterium]|nr:FtsQ-type POTRA domain-containing protein [Clostridia bacterium]
MKNRVLLTMLIVFIVLSFVWITCGTIFVVREIEVEDLTVEAAEPLTNEEINEIVNECGLKGKNVLFNLDKDKIAEEIKAHNPMIKLQSIIAKFPNRVILKVARRMPIYCDQKNKMYFDAEMCVVSDKPVPGCIDITGVELELVHNNFVVGDVVKGKNIQDQQKIEQLKIIASYFPSLAGFEISYKNEDKDIGAERVRAVLSIKSGVTFEIEINFKNKENFFYALQYTDQIYKQELNQASGDYFTSYKNGIVQTVVGGEIYKDEK